MYERVVESERGHYSLWVISFVGVVNHTNSNEHCSVIANPLESKHPTTMLTKQRLNCAYLLAFWYDAVNAYPTFTATTAVKCTPSSI